MRVFAVANVMGPDGCSCIRQFVGGLIAWYAFMTWYPDEGGGAFPVV